MVRAFHALGGDGEPTEEEGRAMRRLAALLAPAGGKKDGGEEEEEEEEEGPPEVEYRTYGPSDRRSFLQRYGGLCYGSGGGGGGGDADSPVLRRYDALASHPSLQLELWKGCMLYLGHGSAYIDAGDVVLGRSYPDAFKGAAAGGGLAVEIDPGAAAEGDGTGKEGGRPAPPAPMVHPSLLIVPEALSEVPLGIVRILVETSNAVLASSPLLVPRETRRLIDADSGAGGEGGGGGGGGGGGRGWTILRSRCARLADPSVTVRSLWEGVRLPAAAPIEGSLAEQSGPGTHAAISGEPYGTSRLHPHRHGSLHVQADSESSPVHTSATPDANSRRVSRHCVHPSGGMCCEVYDPVADRDRDGDGDGDADAAALPVLMVRHPVSGQGAVREVPSRDRTGGDEGEPSPLGPGRPLPYLTDLGRTSTVGNVTYTVPWDEIQYLSTVREVRLGPPEEVGVGDWDGDANGFTPIPTPNLFDMLLENDCLPTSKNCQSCLKRVRDGKGFDCKACAKECGCYCKVLCKIRPPDKRVVKEYRIYPPAVRRDGTRLVPRIVHQTWYEPVTREKYPNMSRLIESWKRSGWEYNFYDDDTAAAFLSTHFPPEVREAYDAVLPGAFKADLFRYCVLLIKGGIYADMDVLLESDPDAMVSGDVGFMVPMDSPGTKIGRRSCLWNGLMAVSPGHPLLARTIEIVVNNIRNRFTSVDYDDMLCPNPVFQISHSVDTLFTCGPCILGAAINDVLGRHMQEPYEPGDIDIWETERLEQGGGEGGEKGLGIVVDPGDPRLLIPGRTIILQQNKQDMGAHRFTWAEENLVVAATDMPDYDDRPPTLVHYSKTHSKAGVYGVKKLYADNVKADEKIRLVVQPVY